MATRNEYERVSSHTHAAFVNSRRRFLISGAASLAGLDVSGAAWSSGSALRGAVSRDEGQARARAAEVIRDYDLQGPHRTGTAVDSASAHWLVDQLRRSGVQSRLEGFSIRRIEPHHCFLEVDGRCISGVPLYDAGCTTSAGVGGTLGDFESVSDIAMLSIAQGDELLREASSPLVRARQSHHRGIVLIAHSSRPGLALLNAESFLSPSGPPMLHVTNAESDWLKQCADRRLPARLVVPCTRVSTQAYNVIGFVRGQRSDLAPLVIMTPRSGWWNCASERGGGIVAWLESARAVSLERPARNVFLVATTAHELGMIGLDAFLASRPHLAKDAHAWIHFGASIGALGQSNLVQASDSALIELAREALGAQGLNIDALAPANASPGGEVRRIYGSGGRYISLLADNPLFHLSGDRWPEAVDINSVARQATAFASLAVHLTRTS